MGGRGRGVRLQSGLPGRMLQCPVRGGGGGRAGGNSYDARRAAVCSRFGKKRKPAGSLHNKYAGRPNSCIITVVQFKGTTTTTE